MKACLILVLVGVAMMGPRVDAAPDCPVGEATHPKLKPEKDGAVVATGTDCATETPPANACKVTFTEATKKFVWACSVEGTAPTDANKKCLTKADFGAPDNGVVTCVSIAGVDAVQPAPEDLLSAAGSATTAAAATTVAQPNSGGGGGETAAEGSGNSFKPGYLPFVVAAVVVLGKSFVAV